MNGDRVFVDTNIFVYAYDLDAGSKHSIAFEAVKGLWRSRLGVISTQILQEFYVTVTKKLSSPLEIPVAKDVVKKLSKWDVVTNDINTVWEAIDLQERFQYSFWDSLVIASALEGGANTILSEDMSENQKINGITITNPFR